MVVHIVYIVIPLPVLLAANIERIVVFCLQTKHHPLVIDKLWCLLQASQDRIVALQQAVAFGNGPGSMISITDPAVQDTDPWKLWNMWHVLRYHRWRWL